MANRTVDMAGKKCYPREYVYEVPKIPRGLQAWRHKQRRMFEEQYSDNNRKMKGVIYHYGLFKIIWDWFVLLLVLYTAIEVPFVVAFIVDDMEAESSKNQGDMNLFLRYYREDKGYFALLLVDLLVDLFFFCDIIVNFRTTYIGKNDTLVTSPKKIAIHYLRTYFIVDLVAAVPWDVIAGPYTLESTTSLSLLKTVRLLRLFHAARRLDQNYEKSVSLLFLMVFVFTLVAHWMACIWYYIGYSEIKKFNKNSWLFMLADQSGQPFNRTAGLFLPSVKSRYLTSLYFTLTCLTSVGFGNVSANTDFERLFTIISMLVGGLLFAAVFGNVSAIIYGHYSGTFKFRERMQSVKYFLGFHKIKGPLARKVKDYARHMWTQTKGISTIKVMKQFPPSLQEEISCYLHYNVIKNCPLFEDADESCLWSLAVRMVRLHHLPNNEIVRQASIVKSVYFINRGKLDVYRNGVVVGTIGQGDTFGNLCLNDDNWIHKSAVTLRCSCCVDIHILDRKDLNEVLESFPEFRKGLLKKTSTILKKTVLTSQIISSWDAIEVEETCPEHRGLLKTWIGRQKSKRNCNVDDQKNRYPRKLKNVKGVNETLATLPLVVLGPACSSGDDVQKLWRFANIIECRDEQTGGTFETSFNATSKGDIVENNVNKSSPGFDKNSLRREHTVRGEDNSLDESFSNSEYKEKQNVGLERPGHSQDCEFHDSQSNQDSPCEEMDYKRLESAIHQINSKLKLLENKMDTILNLLQDQSTTRC